MTYDNVKEFADHAVVNEDKLTAYFTDPFASRQHGSNKNFNGLLRQYIPKKTSSKEITEKLRMIQNRLNHRPSKQLSVKNPYDVFHQSLTHFALRT